MVSLQWPWYTHHGCSASAWLSVKCGLPFCGCGCPLALAVWRSQIWDSRRTSQDFSCAVLRWGIAFLSCSMACIWILGNATGDEGQHYYKQVKPSEEICFAWKHQLTAGVLPLCACSKGILTMKYITLMQLKESRKALSNFLCSVGLCLCHWNKWICTSEMYIFVATALDYFLENLFSYLIWSPNYNNSDHDTRT